jgi:hypothetical protein
VHRTPQKALSGKSETFSVHGGERLILARNVLFSSCWCNRDLSTIGKIAGKQQGANIARPLWGKATFRVNE